jgi:CheY-like chemotaxis protein
MKTPAKIVVIEDNPGDIRLLKEAFNETAMPRDIVSITDGETAIDFLIHSFVTADCPSPDLIILDLNLPGKSGHEILTEIKSNPILKHIPVIILSSSKDQEDVTKAYNNRANCYITKPIDLAGYMQVIKSINDFWLGEILVKAGEI